MTSRSALITGVTGQDGAYLAARLLLEDYRVFGVCRPAGADDWRLHTLGITDHPKLQLISHDLSDLQGNHELITDLLPDEVYNLAAISTLANAVSDPLETGIINGLVPVSLLQAIHQSSGKSRFFQASSAEIFGQHRSDPQTEATPFAPSGPYAIAKCYAHQMVDYYRDNCGVFACNGILYNHESPLRGEAFVSRKITSGLVDVASGKLPFLEIGNLDAMRDWGFAPDYVDAMHRMLKADRPNTYILCSGRLETVRNFVTQACAALKMDIEWRGQGLEETGVDRNTGAVVVKVSPQFYRAEADTVAAAVPLKAAQQLGWKAGTELDQICAIMIAADLSRRS